MATTAVTTPPEGAGASGEQKRARRAVPTLNVVMADKRPGIGPFLGVFLNGKSR